jgi:hypothetical protein
LGLNVSGPMDGSSLSPGTDAPEEEKEEGRPSPVSALVSHGEEGAEPDRRSDAVPTADARPVAEIETCMRN